MGPKIKPYFSKDEPWDLFCYSNRNYAGDPDYFRSVSRYILYVKGVPLFCILKAQ